MQLSLEAQSREVSRPHQFCISLPGDGHFFDGLAKDLERDTRLRLGSLLLGSLSVHETPLSVRQPVRPQAVTVECTDMHIRCTVARVGRPEIVINSTT